MSPELSGPLIIINFKAYEESTASRAVELAKSCEVVAEKYQLNIFVAPQHSDIARVSQNVRKTKVIAQHIDPLSPGPYTGHVTALSVKEAGAVGTLINHSERKLQIKDIEACIQLSRRFGLLSICCAEDIRSSQSILGLDPDFLAYEPPELIGSGISVSKVKPEVVSSVVDLAEKINPRTRVLCGAGIVNGEDVRMALDLGTSGILVASGVVKAKNPMSVLVEFAESVSKHSGKVKD